jgi:carboxypeptidase Q
MSQKRFLLPMVLATVFLQMGHDLASQEEDSVVAVDRRILTEIADHSELVENLRYLTDEIGPRLTGSSDLERASEWAAERFRVYGLSNVHLEKYAIPHAWQRGTVRAKVVAPSTHLLVAEAAGWSTNTPGTIRGRLVYVEAEKEEDFVAYRGKLRGAIVITKEPHPRERFQERPLLPRPVRTRVTSEKQQLFRIERGNFLRSEGVLGELRDSNKSFGLFDMDTAGTSFEPSPIPTAFLSPEGYDLIWRLLQVGKPVEVELTIEGCVFSSGPVQVSNTVAEIPGSEKPDEVVILGAHLDSWDLGTGATDNGTGDSVVLEAARALRKLNVKPVRTIRFILFSGEEQYDMGSRAYVEAHRAELEKVSAVLVHDYGTGRVKTIQLQGQGQLVDVMERVARPIMSMLGMKELSLETEEGSDHYSFLEAGVPGFFCDQEVADARTHHSQADTYEKIVFENLVNGAQVMAAFAYNVSQLDRLLPRVPVSSGK